ncbi:hypothetical protein Pcinc_007842 [Petrolisthes cinctipes]|uniref:Uncharacterized protein n=1 Tax=Petrolisthes cinctipes TaxID=88211 RepID=A0AAE1KY50_PETCI|nr:hypothetical protein Pcinc_007842 [Petrolisthes cinctipes]
MNTEDEQNVTEVEGMGEIDPPRSAVTHLNVFPTRQQHLSLSPALEPSDSPVPECKHLLHPKIPDGLTVTPATMTPMAIYIVIWKHMEDVVLLLLFVTFSVASSPLISQPLRCCPPLSTPALLTPPLPSSPSPLLSLLFYPSLSYLPTPLPLLP